MQILRFIKQDIDRAYNNATHACEVILCERGTEKANDLDSEYVELLAAAKEFKAALGKFNYHYNLITGKVKK